MFQVWGAWVLPPRSSLEDKYGEEMNFPTLFYGNAHDHDITNRFSYQKIVQWELLQASGDFSYHTTIFFFKTIRIIIDKVLSCIRV